MFLEDALPSQRTQPLPVEEIAAKVGRILTSLIVRLRRLSHFIQWQNIFVKEPYTE